MNEKNGSTLTESGNPGAAYLDMLRTVDDVVAIKNIVFECMGLPPNPIVLDVGCGTGEDARAIAERCGPTAKVCGIDVDPEILAEAKNKNHGYDSRVMFRRESIYETTLPTGVFHAVRADRVFQWLTDPQKALAEMARMAQSGGKIVVYEPDWGMVALYAPGDCDCSDAVSSFMADHVFADGRIGRKLYSLFINAGLQDVGVIRYVGMMTNIALAKKVLFLEKVLEDMCEQNILTKEVADTWLRQLHSGPFICAIPGFIVAGTKPA